MLPRLPTFDDMVNAARSGLALNRIRERIYKQTLKSSSTIKVSDTDRGQRLDRIGGVGAGAALSLGFAVVHTGASVTVAAGKVLCPTWSGATGADWRPNNWTAESNYVGGVVSSAATQVWLKIEFSESDQESEGALGLTGIDMSGAAGGRGGGGGGGGSSLGDSGVYYLSGGFNGTDGSAGGAGGEGGECRALADDAPVGDGLSAYGANGGYGGAGGNGAAGTAETFTRPTKAVVQVRHYVLSGLSVHTSKGAASETAAWVQLATISAGTVVQHHIGTLRITPATVTFIEP